MAGSFPALHWWPTIVTAWALGLIVLSRGLTISNDKDRTPFHLGVEIFISIVFLIGGFPFIIGFSTWLGLPGLGIVMAITGLASLHLFRGPNWAKRTALGLHVGLILSMLICHLYFWGLQHHEGKVRYALQYGSGTHVLDPILRDMPLPELYQLTEKTMRQGPGADLLNQIITERSSEVLDLDDAQLEALSRQPMSDALRQRVEKVVEERKNRDS